MPLIKIHTSKSTDDAAYGAVMKMLSGALAQITGKPERVIMVTLEKGPVVMAGELVEGAFVEVRGIGGLDPDTNVTITQKVCTVLQTELQIEPNNVYLNFFDMPRADWGWNNKTFA